MSRSWILHVRLDEFVVAVELQCRPRLRGKPLIVGGVGDPNTRGVVSAVSCEARRRGVRSGMPLRTAARRCPEGIFLPLDARAYVPASRQVMSALRRFPGTLEQTGWDEAFLELATDAPEQLARRIQRAIRERTGLSCSVGIGENKIQARVAATLARPSGVFRLTGQTWEAATENEPTELLPGVGRRRRVRLARLGLETVGELARADKTPLVDELGPHVGPWLRRLARGEDDAPVLAHHPPAKSHGHEHTFPKNVDDVGVVRRELVRLAQQLGAKLAHQRRPAARIVVTVRFASFETHSHTVSLPRAGADGASFVQAALAALERFELDQPVRLIGVRAELGSTRVDADQLSLFAG